MIDLYKYLSEWDAEDPDSLSLSLSLKLRSTFRSPSPKMHSSSSSRRLQAPASTVASSVIIVDKVL